MRTDLRVIEKTTPARLSAPALSRCRCQQLPAVTPALLHALVACRRLPLQRHCCLGSWAFGRCRDISVNLIAALPLHVACAMHCWTATHAMNAHIYTGEVPQLAVEPASTGLEVPQPAPQGRVVSFSISVTALQVLDSGMAA